MGNLRAKSWGYRHGTRNKYSKHYKTKGVPAASRYLTTFKRGDYVDVVVDSSIQKGMPYSFYHGRTGIVFNVNRNAIGVEITKVPKYGMANEQLRKRIHVRLEHLRKSRCNEMFLKRVKENDRIKREAKMQNLPAPICKRTPEGPKPGKFVKAIDDQIEVLAPLPFIENYF